ncbi:hypothetical protein BDN70DRAFT_890892 [Pholiota conissans]|uniref:F-box domain-containing protein n=1 Tax=Pholiota conissans TaxID=109636 RepID=A0A9P6D6G1_9AGAR|nr:hypothetical protein BDN70DRAFT_890892 [Pholiota conissans]
MFIADVTKHFAAFAYSGQSLPPDNAFKLRIPLSRRKEQKSKSFRDGYIRSTSYYTPKLHRTNALLSEDFIYINLLLGIPTSESTSTPVVDSCFLEHLMALELPTELWLRIAQYVPDRDIFRLASVNRLFLDLATDRRYRHLVIDDDDPIALIQKLSRIEQDSSVAARVRSLTIHPKAVRSACLKSGKAYRRQRSLTNRYWPDSFRLRTERAPLEEDTELADRFLDTLARLPNIEEYAVEWEHGVQAERAFCVPLLSAMWPLQAAHTLRSISLEMMLAHLCDMLPPDALPCLERVEDLRLHFTRGTDTWSGSVGETSGALLTRLAAFVNRLAPSLTSLYIASIGHFDFSQLYADLGFFPRLVQLAIIAPCDPRHIVDPTCFNTFLNMHKGTISSLAFAPQYCCYQSALGPDAGAAVTTTDEWFARAFAGVDFAHLYSLQLGLNILGSGGKRVMDPVPLVAAAAARNLERLGVWGCIISLEDLRLLLEPFAQTPGPRCLVLEVHVLDVALLDLLAAYLPGLHTLHLTYRWVGSSGMTNVIKFTEELEGKVFAPWTALWQVTLLCSRQDDQSRWPCQKSIVRCLPRYNKAPLAP